MKKGNKGNRFTAAQMIGAIKGSGGVKTVIAQRLGCHRHTVDNHLERFSTVLQAYLDEVETIGDFAESVLVQNIQLAYKEQQTTKMPVDASDAKWFLERKRADYSPRYRNLLAKVDVTQLTDDQLDKIASGEDPVNVLFGSGKS